MWVAVSLLRTHACVACSFAPYSGIPEALLRWVGEVSLLFVGKIRTCAETPRRAHNTYREAVECPFLYLVVIILISVRDFVFLSHPLLCL